MATILTDDVRTFPKGTIDDLDVLLEVDLTIDPDLELDGPVAFGIGQKDAFETATWVGEPGPSRIATFTLDTTDLEARAYTVYVRLGTRIIQADGGFVVED